MIAITLSEMQVFGIAFCVVTAALLAALALACDRDGRLRAR